MSCMGYSIPILGQAPQLASLGVARQRQRPALVSQRIIAGSLTIKQSVALRQNPRDANLPLFLGFLLLWGFLPGRAEKMFPAFPTTSHRPAAIVARWPRLSRRSATLACPHQNSPNAPNGSSQYRLTWGMADFPLGKMLEKLISLWKIEESPVLFWDEICSIPLQCLRGQVSWHLLESH